MAYQALYRTYRPQLFREVVGQERIVQTLQNSIAQGKTSHAYLFCGPRGTGKTSVARIFAKALNCAAVELAEPCNKCQSCLEITDGASLDVIEIDAASNNGVDEIREIREKVKFLPVGAKHKVYIIDEVHMLSTGAFNALLKVLEEPPAHVIFILATTEPQKLPATIISRCQRFDFSALSIIELTKKLRQVAADENAIVSEEALNAIAEAAEGGLRDALGILDQAISYSDSAEIQSDDVAYVTGNINYNTLIDLGTQIVAQNATAALEGINKLFEAGKEVQKIVRGLIQLYRDILLYQSTDSPLYVKYVFQQESFQLLAQKMTKDRLFYYLNALSDVLAKLRYSPNTRIYLEIAIIKMTSDPGAEAGLEERIKNLEKKVDNLNVADSAGGSDSELKDRVDKIVNELNRLEIPAMAERITALETQKNAGGGSANAAQNLRLDEIEEDIFILKAQVANNNIGRDDDDETGEANPLLGELAAKIEKLEQASRRQASNEAVAALENRVSELAEQNGTATPTAPDLSDLYDRVAGLEERTQTKSAAYGAAIEELKAQVAELMLQRAVKKEPRRAVKPEAPGQMKLFELNEQQPAEQETDSAPEAAPAIEPQAGSQSVPEAAPTTEPTPETDRESAAESEATPEAQAPVTTAEAPAEPVTERRESALAEAPEPEPVTSDPFAAERAAFSERQAQDALVNSQDLLYGIYPITAIESAMNEAVAEKTRHELRQLKSQVVEVFKNPALHITSPEHGQVANHFKTCKPLVVSSKLLVITYPTAAMCNLVSDPKFKKLALEALAGMFGRRFDYIALPDADFQKIKLEFNQQYSSGVFPPKLTPIHNPDLINYAAQPIRKTPAEEAQEAIEDFFGKQIND